MQGRRGHLVVVQRRVIAQGTDSRQLHQPIELPASHQLLSLPPEEPGGQCKGLGPVPERRPSFWPHPQEALLIDSSQSGGM